MSKKYFCLKNNCFSLWEYAGALKEKIPEVFRRTQSNSEEFLHYEEERFWIYHDWRIITRFSRSISFWTIDSTQELTIYSKTLLYGVQQNILFFKVKNICFWNATKRTSGRDNKGLKFPSSNDVVIYF